MCLSLLVMWLLSKIVKAQNCINSLLFIGNRLYYLHLHKASAPEHE